MRKIFGERTIFLWRKRRTKKKNEEIYHGKGKIIVDGRVEGHRNSKVLQVVLTDLRRKLQIFLVVSKCLKTFVKTFDL